jgi:hypothetical protein
MLVNLFLFPFREEYTGSCLFTEHFNPNLAFRALTKRVPSPPLGGFGPYFFQLVYNC